MIVAFAVPPSLPLAPARRAGRGLAWALAAWAFAYACYRAYYAAGGTVGLFGEPVSVAQFRAVNAVGAGIILAAAVVPPVTVRVRRAHRVLPGVAWLVAVGCCAHAVVNGALRILSLAGAHPTVLPADVWRWYDRRTSDLQDLLLNEPWFLVEGLLWAALGLVFVAPARRRAWVSTAVAVCLVASVAGVLSGIGVIGSVRIG